VKVKDPKAIIEHIGQWLREKLTIKPDHEPVAVIGLSGGIDSALVALICLYNNIEVVTVNMSCHSSKWSFDRAQEFTSTYRLKFISIPLTDAADNILDWADHGLYGYRLGRLGWAQLPKQDMIDRGSFFSCLRAPVLDYVAKRVGGLIVGTGNRDEDFILRYFNKRGDGAVDLSPIADLHKSEVRQLFEWLAFECAPTSFKGEMPPAADAILEAKPSADLWGGEPQYDEDELGLTYDQVEEVDKIVEVLEPEFWSLGLQDREFEINLWLDNEMISNNEAEIIRKVSAMELVTKHKANPNIPVCPIREHDEWFVNDTD